MPTHHFTNNLFSKLDFPKLIFAPESRLGEGQSGQKDAGGISKRKKMLTWNLTLCSLGCCALYHAA